MRKRSARPTRRTGRGAYCAAAVPIPYRALYLALRGPGTPSAAVIIITCACVAAYWTVSRGAPPSVPLSHPAWISLRVRLVLPTHSTTIRHDREGRARGRGIRESSKSLHIDDSEGHRVIAHPNLHLLETSSYEISTASLWVHAWFS